MSLVVGIRIPYALHKIILPSQKRTDCRVAALLATAAYHDSTICRLVPLGAMTEVIFTPLCLFPIGYNPRLVTPQSAAGRQLP